MQISSNNTLLSSTSQPLVSVVMACYNNETNIEDTLHSLVNQSYQTIELIIIDDFSKDQTLSVINKFLASHPIVSTIIKNTQNKGLTQCLIDGCKLAKGTYIARHDAGDTSSTNRFKAQVEHLENNPNCGLIFTALEMRDAIFNKVFATTHRTSNDNTDSLDINNTENIECPSHHGSAMFRKSIYIQSGGYRYPFYYSQDLDLWLRMRKHANYCVINHATYTSIFSISDISGYARVEQQLFKQLAISSAQSPSDDSASLKQAIKLHATITKNIKPHYKRRSMIKAQYYIAACLLQKGYQKEARYYLLQTLSYFLTHPKYWVKFCQTYFKINNLN